MARGSNLNKFRGFRREAKLMITAGLIENLGWVLNGFVLVLYLTRLGHSTVLFGALAGVMEVSHTAVLLGSGHLADRFGRKRMLLLGSVLGTLGLFIFAFYDSVPLFYVAAVLMGANSGFWGPAFNALLAEKTRSKRRSYLFSLNSIIGQTGIGIVTLVAGFIPLFFISQLNYAVEEAYRMIYVMALLLKFVGILLILNLRSDISQRKFERGITPGKKPWGLIAKFALPTAFTGFGAALIVPYFAFYFDAKFSLEIESIGIIYALLAFTMAAMTVFLPRLSEKGGTVLTSTLFHFSAIIAMISIPFTPWLSLVVFLFVFRAAMMNVPGPIMTSFMMTKIPRDVRATAASSNQFAWMVTHAAGVFLGGFIWESDTSLTLPFYYATFFYVTSVILYMVFFIKMDDKKHAPLVPRFRQRNL